MKYAIIDIDANSVHFIIYHQPNGHYEELINQTKHISLISYIKDNILSLEGLERLITTLKQFQNIFQQCEVEKTYYFATAAFSHIANRHDILTNIKENLQIDIEILSYAEEGLLDFYGMQQSIDMDSGVMIDIGGGSCEIVYFEHHHIKQNQYFPIGSLNLYNEFVKGITPTTKELNEMYQYIKKQLQHLDTNSHSIHAIGIGGTMRAMISIARQLLRKNHIENMITKEEIDYLIRQLTRKSKRSTHTVLKLRPERIHTLIPGLILLKEIISLLKIQDLTISYTGVREGYFFHKILQKKEF